MAHNLEYLLTRPGILKMVTIVLGIISFAIGTSSYTKSAYTDFYSNMTSDGDGNELNLPGTELELYQVTVTGIYLGISTAYLLLYGLFYELCESKLNRIVDTFVHMSGGLFVFAGGCVLCYSMMEIKHEGCDEYYELTPSISKVLGLTMRKATLGKTEGCQYLGEKIVAGIFTLVNGVVYTALGIIIFVEKDL